MKCFLCRGKKFREQYENADYKIVSCPSCDLYFKVAKIKPKKLYDKNYFEAYPYSNFLNLNKIYFKNKLNRLNAVLSRHRLLDIGCGWGDFLEVCRDENIPYLGIDESEEAIKICKKKKLNCMKAKIPVLRDLRVADPASAGEHAHGVAKRGIELSYNTITLFQVIEHLKNPLPLLKSAKKLLAPGGIILITTPNNDSPLRKLTGVNWSVYNTKSHFVFYNKNTLKKTLEAAGFKNVQVKLDSPRFLSLGYILSRLNQMYFKLLTFNFSLLTLPLPTDPLGDLVLTAVKL